MLKTIIIFFVSVLFISSCKTDHSNSSEEIINFDNVQVEGGLISGIAGENDEVHVFKGIPFAAVPVGDLRWKIPAPVQPWAGVKK